MCHAGGQNLPPFLRWRAQRDWPRRSTPPFQFWQLHARPSWTKGILHLLPLGASPGVCFFPTVCPVRMFKQQPLLLTMAYTQALQYWVEKFRASDHPDCPLAMSVVELMQSVKKHVVFYKWDLLQGLGRIAPETVNWDPADPKGHPITQATITDVGGMGSNSGRHIVHGTTPSIFGPLPEEETPPVESIALPTADNVGHTPPGLANPPLERDAIVLSTMPTTASVVELTSPIILPDQTEEERWYVLVVTASVRRLNLESTRVVLRDTVTTSAGGAAFQNPQMAAVLPGPVPGRRPISSQGAYVEELAREDTGWEQPIRDISQPP